MKSISYAYLEGTPGCEGVKLGVRVYPADRTLAGKTVAVSRRDHKQFNEELGRCLVANNGGGASWYSLARLDRGRASAEGNRELMIAIAKLEKLEAEGRLKGFTQGCLDAYRRDGYLSPKRISCLVTDRDRRDEQWT